MDLQSGDNRELLSDLSIYYTWKNIKTWSTNNKRKISETTWDEVFGVPNGFYSISNIQDYFKYIFRKNETLNE